MNEHEEEAVGVAGRGHEVAAGWRTGLPGTCLTLSGTEGHQVGE